MDPVTLFTNKETIRHVAHAIIQKGKKVKGHIFNLGHGILPNTPVEHVKYLIDVVKNG